MPTDDDRQFVTLVDDNTLHINLDGVHPDNFVGTLARESAQRLQELERLRLLGNTSGVWFVYGTDMNDYPMAIYGTEVEALRHANENYGKVKFWPVGTRWGDVT